MKKTQEFDMKPVPLKRPVDNKLAQGAEVAALNSLLDMMNNPEITGAVIPPGVETKAVIAPQREILDKTGAEQPAPGLTTPAQAAPRRVNIGSKIFFTGLIGSGKDFCAEQMGAKIFGLADPLYHLAEYFFGVIVSAKEGKQLPGMRAFLQVCGQYGRGDATEKLPYTAARACFISMIRSLGEGGRFDAQYEIDWSGYGKNADIWLDGLSRRVTVYQAATPDSCVAVTNVRFSNEFTKLKALGWEHAHIMASPQTRAVRVKVDTAAANDTSEQLANFLNNDVTQKISKQPRGGKLNTIWNDTVASPSPRLYSVPEFLRRVQAPAAANESSIITGE